MSAKFALAALAMSAVAAAAPAYAEEAPQMRAFPVSYADLNMSSPSGGRTLLGRIERAARRVCGAAIPRSPLLQRQAIDCRREVVATTVQNLGLPTLSVAWTGKYPATVMASR